MNLNNLDLSCNVGNIKVNNCEINDSKISNDTGNIEINKSKFKNLEANLNLGNINSKNINVKNLLNRILFVFYCFCQLKRINFFNVDYHSFFIILSITV